MKYTLLLLSTLTIFQPSFSQEIPTTTPSPYKTSFKTDAPIIGAGLGLSALGLSMMQKKEALTDQELANKSFTDVPRFDRFSAGYFSTKADEASYLPFYGSFVMPVAMLANRNIRQKSGQVMTLYLETMAVTGMVYSLTAGSVYRSRPLVYGAETPLDKRKSKNSQRSFFAGHTAATAAASFFAAKVFNDFNPDSKARPYVWAAAAAVPASVGYLRIKAGQHFLSDNLIGYGVGAAAGILVPQLHKTKGMENLSMTPAVVDGVQGMAVSYKF